MFGNGPEPSTTTIEVRNGLESSVRSKLRQVKVPSGIGALHFQTMEPYREGNLVYDSEDDLPPEQYEWRRYRSGQLCERTSQLSIIKKCNLQIKPKEIGEPEHDARYREWSMAHQLRTLWNQYLHSITTKPSSSPSSILHYPDLVKFIGIYVQCYSPDPTARFELIKFLLCFDFRNPNDFQCDGHDDRSGREHIIDHIHSLLKYYDSTERSKKLHYSRSTSWFPVVFFWGTLLWTCFVYCQIIEVDQCSPRRLISITRNLSYGTFLIQVIRVYLRLDALVYSC